MKRRDRPVLFLDDGGVMNDNARRAPEWQRLTGAFLAPRLGGSPEAWSEANRRMTVRLFGAGGEALRRQASDVAEHLRRARIAWLHWMCDELGRSRLPDAEALLVTEAATAYITRRVQAAFPGAAAAILQLHMEGWTLHTASGEPSDELDGYLRGMGVRQCFGRRLYGPDLIDTWKEGAEYHSRIFEDAGVAPADAVVVDDSPQAVTWAAQAGAIALLLTPDPSTPLPAGAAGCLPALAELPTWLSRTR